MNKDNPPKQTVLPWEVPRLHQFEIVVPRKPPAFADLKRSFRDCPAELDRERFPREGLHGHLRNRLDGTEVLPTSCGKVRMVLKTFVFFPEETSLRDWGREMGLVLCDEDELLAFGLDPTARKLLSTLQYPVAAVTTNVPHPRERSKYYRISLQPSREALDLVAQERRSGETSGWGNALYIVDPCHA